MQAIITVILVLLSFAEAGLIAKAPRTDEPALQTPSQFYIIPPTTITTSTSTTTPSPTGTAVVIPTPTTGTSYAMTTQGAVSPPLGDLGSDGPGVVVDNDDDDNNNNPAHHEPVTTSAAGPPAGDELDALESGQQQVKFVQTTYFACVTRALSTHCGWHEPILDTSAAAAAAVVGTSPGESLALRASLLAALTVAVLAIGL